MGHTLRTVATCALAFALMAVVGSATRETDGSSRASAESMASVHSGPAFLQGEVTPGRPLSIEAPLPGDMAPANVIVPVTIKGFVYIPETVTVPAGSSVEWTNEDNAPHTSTGISEAVSALDSGAIVFGQTFTQRFENPGTYPYYCVYHPNMLGTVVVTP